ncbi:MAG: DUF2238 domain-containing protein [Sterolibacteriaceae bacterium MAG5]|nr:DUF2238 domain-containing protein [Candidatus Nitricoxidireducens bremensis]
MPNEARLPALLGAVVAAALVVSGLHPHDRPTWLLETLPAMIVLAVLAATFRRFPLTPLLYVLIALHALVLIYGGAYTYALTPFGDWLRETFALTRNPYDRLGHFMQGFVPAMAAREILLRHRVVNGPRWRAFLIVCVCLAISACYEFLEWWTALAIGADADAFLATQGDPWDTQWDMALAGVGACGALILLGRMHDRQLARFEHSP